MDLETLKAHCFKQRVDPTLEERYRRSWAIYYALYVTHFFSIRLVRLLLKTPVTPNQVSYFSILIGWCSGLLFLLNEPISLLIGALCFEFFYILDAVDGQLARARNQCSRGGAFLDDVGNFLVPPFVIFCIGVRPPLTKLQVIEAFLASLSILIIPIVELIKVKLALESTSDRKLPAGTKRGMKWLRSAYSLLYRSCTMPVVMNLVSIATILTLIHVKSPLTGMPFLVDLIHYYASIGSFVWMTKGIYIAKTST